MMEVKINWLWDMQVKEGHVQKVLKDPCDPEFYIFAEKLFARVKDRELAFEYVDKKTFIRTWPSIKKRVLKDAWAKLAVDFWQNIYASEMAQNQQFNLTRRTLLSILCRSSPKRSIPALL